MQVLVTVLDVVRMTPCADVRVDELDRLKMNMRKLLQYGFPETDIWQQLGWLSLPIEEITQLIVNWNTREKLTLNENCLASQQVNTNTMSSSLRAPITGFEGTFTTIYNRISDVPRLISTDSQHYRSAPMHSQLPVVFHRAYTRGDDGPMSDIHNAGANYPSIKADKENYLH